MKKYISMLLVFCMALLSCSKDNTDDNPNTYRAVIKQNFKDPFKNPENIQVEDYIPYTITITDSKDDQNVEYRLISVRENQYYHQTIWKDFGFYLVANDQSPFDVEQKHISFYKKGTHTFYIRPFVPGTFKHTYYLQKLINGKEVGDKIKLTNEFNAVKINVMKGERWHSPADVATLYYFVYIDDGREQTDNYLNIPQGGTLSCEITINGETYVHRTRYNNEEFYIRDVGETPRLGNISLVKLTLRAKGLPDFVVEYHNIKHNFN
ncbi:hypothetical protein ACILD6_09810 [Capnocytophaga canimorsus]|uniref:Uncharacterized protein n=1 Tax=Capnocytophaga canimorsus TaxID=28188 RepID=A0A0B7IAM3_9FLAO|nr:hypothetical protein [Capnocytophaga canimorsus]ATA94171.1 hypothetical protein CGC54_07450 [Capnocytophaga canimorsus]CEN49006.1 conserved exported hypothetical protein [Capnocytophaga canimorsus]